MKNAIKKLLVDKKEHLPLLSNYWEVLGNEIEKETKEKNNTFNTISVKHQTSCYILHTFYKPISTTIDLNYYD